MQASESLKCIPLQLVLAAVAVEMSVAQMLKLHWGFVKVSVAVVAELMTMFFSPALNTAETHGSLISICLEVFLF